MRGGEARGRAPGHGEAEGERPRVAGAAVAVGVVRGQRVVPSGGADGRRAAATRGRARADRRARRVVSQPRGERRGERIAQRAVAAGRRGQGHVDRSALPVALRRPGRRSEYRLRPPVHLQGRTVGEREVAEVQIGVERAGADGAAVQRQHGTGHAEPVGIHVGPLHPIDENQRVAERQGVGHLPRRAADVEREPGRAAHADDFAERHRGGDLLTEEEGVAAARRWVEGEVRHRRRVRGEDRDRDRQGIRVAVRIGRGERVGRRRLGRRRRAGDGARRGVERQAVGRGGGERVGGRAVAAARRGQGQRRRGAGGHDERLRRGRERRLPGHGDGERLRRRGCRLGRRAAHAARRRVEAEAGRLSVVAPPGPVSAYVVAPVAAGSMSSTATPSG